MEFGIVVRRPERHTAPGVVTGHLAGAMIAFLESFEASYLVLYRVRSGRDQDRAVELDKTALVIECPKCETAYEGKERPEWQKDRTPAAERE